MDRRILPFVGGVGALLLAACSSSTPSPAPASSAGSASTTATAAGPTTSTPISPASPATSTSPATSASGSGECRASSVTLGVQPSAGGASAGHVGYDVIATNAASGTTCRLQGYPGVSLVVGTAGQQLGAPAARTPADAPAISLAPGQRAVAQVQLTQASNVDACQVTAAAGFRLYLPDETNASFTPLVVDGCANPAAVVLQVKPFGAT